MSNFMDNNVPKYECKVVVEEKKENVWDEVSNTFTAIVQSAGEAVVEAKKTKDEQEKSAAGSSNTQTESN
ncbi:MAG: hypothetical protein J1G02_06410 [Clostridiales bacterium]|nr:hypothetical protein [Clostridiales bacterium]